MEGKLNKIIEEVDSSNTDMLAYLLSNKKLFHFKEITVINKKTGSVITIQNQKRYEITTK